MFTRTSTASLSALGAALALLAFALGPSLAAADSLVPLHATVSETYTATPCGIASRCITATGTGFSIHLGAITEQASVVVDLNPADAQGGCAPELRTDTLTAANGDSITMTASGWSCPATSDAHDTYTITGGTGRFAGATGSGAEYNTHTFTGPGIGVASVVYDGTVSSVGSLNP